MSSLSSLFYDFLPALKIFEDRKMSKARFKKLLSNVRFYKRLKRVGGCLELTPNTVKEVQ